jgi:hypothetical protein
MKFDDLDRATRVFMQRFLCLACAFLALLPHTSSSPNQPHEDESTDTSIRPWVSGAFSVEVCLACITCRLELNINAAVTESNRALKYVKLFS